jgi:hypothetical protein
MTNFRSEADAMRIFVFKSQSNNTLRAFCNELDGAQLPKKFGPWMAAGTIAPGKDLPHGFSRDTVEQAITELGFQIWRLKAKQAAQ